MLAPMESVIPLVEKDFNRFQLLLVSLNKYSSEFGMMHVVVPEREVTRIRSRICRLKIQFEWRVVSEEEIVPEFKHFHWISGWEKQQLIKLAIAEFVQSDYYLTLDADVVCTRAVTPDKLLIGGKAPCFVEFENKYPNWYDSASRVLRCPLAREGLMHNVTPAVLSRHGVISLTNYLSSKWNRFKIPSDKRSRLHVKMWLRTFLQRDPRWVSWRLYLIANLPWTEYSLYYSYLEAKRLFNSLHVEVEVPIYDNKNSIWHIEDFERSGWDPGSSFNGDGPPFFMVLQSNTEIPIEQFSAMLQDYIANDPIL